MTAVQDHCIGCRNTLGRIRGVVDEHCCTCCTDADGSRPGTGKPSHDVSAPS